MSCAAGSIDCCSWAGLPSHHHRLRLVLPRHVLRTCTNDRAARLDTSRRSPVLERVLVAGQKRRCNGWTQGLGHSPSNRPRPATESAAEAVCINEARELTG